MRKGPPGSEDHGGACLVFPLPTRPWRACWAPRACPLPSEGPYSCMGPRGIGRREEEEERQTG